MLSLVAAEFLLVVRCRLNTEQSTPPLDASGTFLPLCRVYVACFIYVGVLCCYGNSRFIYYI